MGRPSILYEIEGRFYTLKDIAHISGCSTATIRDRLKRGWTGKLLLLPPLPPKTVADMDPNVSTYTRAELYDLWRSHFRGRLDEVAMLADFMGSTKSAAGKLLREFKEAENND